MLLNARYYAQHRASCYARVRLVRGSYAAFSTLVQYPLNDPAKHHLHISPRTPPLEYLGDTHYPNTERYTAQHCRMGL